MDQIIKTPGLQHISETILFNLDYEDLMNCQTVDKSIQQILETPMFWLKKWRYKRGLSRKNQLDWIKALQMTKNPNLRKNIVLYIQKVIKIGHFVDVPCYIDNDVTKKATEISFEEALQQKDAGVLQILAPMTRVFNTPDVNLHEVLQLKTPWHNTEFSYLLDVIKVLAPLTENVNSQNEGKFTLIHCASLTGQLDIIKFLVPMIENPNAPNKYGNTPIHYAVISGYLDVIKFLAPMIENPNAPNQSGNTPIHTAARNGHLDVIKFLAPMTENPNAHDNDGKTPIDISTQEGYNEITQFLQSYIKN